MRGRWASLTTEHATEGSRLNNASEPRILGEATSRLNRTFQRRCLEWALFRLLLYRDQAVIAQGCGHGMREVLRLLLAGSRLGAGFGIRYDVSICGNAAAQVWRGQPRGTNGAVVVPRVAVLVCVPRD